ncbi:MAG: hypothetical protein NTZ83_01660, partial [Candidatus Pacearchaeota archaeon]|nr:hypothetical protein [Candidatus Pacearchaeota archaeon]
MTNEERNEKRADSFLERHLGINSREFLGNYLKANPDEIMNRGDYLSYLSNLAIFEQEGQEVEDIMQNKEYKKFYDFLKDSLLDSRIKSTLLEWGRPKHKDPGLTTLISKELFDNMKNYEIKKCILIGKRFYDSKLNTNFDILIDRKNIKELLDINTQKTPIVPYVGYKEVTDHQEYFLSLNQKFPKIEKAF